MSALAARLQAALGVPATRPPAGPSAAASLRGSPAPSPASARGGAGAAATMPTAAAGTMRAAPAAAAGPNAARVGVEEVAAGAQARWARRSRNYMVKHRSRNVQVQDLLPTRKKQSLSRDRIRPGPRLLGLRVSRAHRDSGLRQ